MNEIAGWITIGTKLDNKNLQRQLSQQKNQLQKYAQEQERLLGQKAKAEENLKPYQDEINALKQQAAEAEKIRMTEAQRKANNEMLQDQLDEINNRYSKQISAYEEINKKIDENKNNIATMNAQISKTESQLETSMGFNSVKQSIESSSKSLSGLIKKISRYALAIVGIRGIYTGIRSAMSTISQYDKKLAADLQYIRYALAMSIKPVIEWIVKAIYSLLSAIAGVVKSFTGINIFANASAKSMKSMSKSAKDISKALAPFDEANILGSPSGSNDVSPSFDLSTDNILSDLDLNSFIEKGKEIAEKIAMGINNFFATTDWLGLAEWVIRALVGIIDILISFIETIDWELIGNKIATFLLNVKWEEVGKKLIRLVIDGIIAAIKLSKGISKAIIDKLTDPEFYVDLYNTGKEIITEVIKGMTEIEDSIENVWSSIITWFLTKLGLEENDAVKVGEKIAEGLRIGMEKIIEGLPFYGTIYKIIKLIKDVFGIHSPSKEMEDIGENLIEGLKNGIKNKINSVIDVINTLIRKINNALNFKWNDITIAGVKLLSAGSVNFGKIPTIPHLATGGIVDIPKTGVNIGGAIAGESGREGVLPFTDPRAMSEVGKEIGKWVTVNIDLTNTIDGRVLNKRLEQININKEFARNGVS